MKRALFFLMFIPLALTGCLDLANLMPGGSVARDETVNKKPLPAIDPKLPVQPSSETRSSELPMVEEAVPEHRAPLSQLPVQLNETGRPRPVSPAEITTENAREMAARFGRELNFEEHR